MFINTYIIIRVIKEGIVMLPYGLKKIWKAEIYQGGNRDKEYFEGWYYKIVDSDEKNIYAIIPGISMGQNREESHSFIQIIDGINNSSYYFKYSVDEFKYSKKELHIEIGRNCFELDRIILDIDKDGVRMKGNLEFQNLTPWTSSCLSPGAMGWYSFIPFMECYHGIISLNHDITGTLDMNGRTVSFDGGLGYTEKDWGKSFPNSWIWMQSNHFQEPEISLTLSVADIPLSGKSFTGFIAGLWVKDRLYKFATYTGAKIKGIRIYYNRIYLTFTDKHCELDVRITKSNSGVLTSPKNGVMKGKIHESISSEVEFSLYKKVSGRRKLEFSGRGRNTGLEVMGNIEELLAKI